MNRLTVFLFCAAIAPLAAAPRFTEDFRHSYPLAPGGRITLENFNGPVEITGWDQNNAEISGTKYADTQELLGSVRIDIAATGNSIHIRTLRPEGERHGNMGARYVLKVPRRTELERIASSNGGIHVEDIEGNAKLHTSNGPVKTLRVRGDVEIHTSNGGVEAREVEGNISAHTSNGGVRAESVRGGVDAATSNGGVELRLDSHPNRDVRAATSNGSITVRLPSGLNARVKAVTSGHNHVTSDFDISTRGQIAQHRLEGTIGAGGPLLELTTSNGSIRLARQ